MNKFWVRKNVYSTHYCICIFCIWTISSMICAYHVGKEIYSGIQGEHRNGTRSMRLDLLKCFATVYSVCSFQLVYLHLFYSEIIIIVIKIKQNKKTPAKTKSSWKSSLSRSQAHLQRNRINFMQNVSLWCQWWLLLVESKASRKKGGFRIV